MLISRQTTALGSTADLDDVVRSSARSLLHHHDGPAKTGVFAARDEHSDRRACSHTGRDGCGDIVRPRARDERFRQLQSVCSKEMRRPLQRLPARNPGLLRNRPGQDVPPRRSVQTRDRGGLRQARR